MNLIGDPWIPVIFEDGSTQTVGLKALYEKAGEIRDLVLNPPQRISVMRLLICITQAALDGPEDEEEWLACQKRIISESLNYLNGRQDAFELFGEKPFLQVKALEPINNATLDKLDFRLASGHSPDLFDHEAIKEGRPQTPAWMAVMLLTYQCFSPCGRIGVSTWAGEKTGEGSSEHAPGIEASPLHAILRSENLVDTIHLNLLTKQQVKTLPGAGWGLPVWDAFPAGQQGEEVKTLTHSYLGRLVPLSRAILLDLNNTYCTLVNGLPYPKLPAGRETMATVVVTGQGDDQKHRYIRIDLSRHPWRELGSLLSLNPARGSRGALALDHLRNLSNRTVDLWVGGLLVKQRKLVDVAEWNFALPLSLLGSIELEKYQKGINTANQGEISLKIAVGEYCRLQKAEAGGLRTKAAILYWAVLDASYKRLIDIANDRYADLGQWGEYVLSQMNNAYRETCPHETPRQIQAFAAGRRRLRIRQENN